MYSKVNKYRIKNTVTNEIHEGTAEALGEKLGVDPNAIRGAAHSYERAVSDIYVIDDVDKPTGKDIPEDFERRWNAACALAKRYLEENKNGRRTKKNRRTRN